MLHQGCRYVQKKVYTYQETQVRDARLAEIIAVKQENSPHTYGYRRILKTECIYQYKMGVAPLTLRHSA